MFRLSPERTDSLFEVEKPIDKKSTRRRKTNLHVLIFARYSLQLPSLRSVRSVGLCYVFRVFSFCESFYKCSSTKEYFVFALLQDFSAWIFALLVDPELGVTVFP